jgi:predicted O-linked N-acetylglucosamine transferase (SPINDLY family)
MKRADIFLDTIGFSGFNTAFQAIECGLPIVTREGRFMRGRLASGILKKIGLEELIAQDENAFVNLVVKIASNKEYKSFIRNKIEDNRFFLYGDLEPIRALEKFLESAYRKSKLS